jgi:hypothetical protein
MSLEQIKEKIKPFFKFNHLFLNLLILILFVTLGIGLFLMYKGVEKAEAPTIEKGVFTPEFRILDPKIGDMAGKIVASSGGSVYYYPHCGGLARIKPENRLYFDSAEEAENAGFSLAKNCQKP